MGGRELVASLVKAAAPPRPPFIPILGRVAANLTQTPWDEFTGEAQGHAMAVLEVATAMSADGVTVGCGARSSVTLEAARRVAPLLRGRALVAVLDSADVSAGRALCDAGADMIMLLRPDRGDTGVFRTLANVCAFYQRPLVLVDPDLEAAPTEAQRLGIGGAVVAAPRGDEPGIVGGGLSAASLADPAPPVPPRVARFFWSFAAEVPEDAEPERLAALGAALTA